MRLLPHRPIATLCLLRAKLHEYTRYAFCVGVGWASEASGSYCLGPTKIVCIRSAQGPPSGWFGRDSRTVSESTCRRPRAGALRVIMHPSQRIVGEEVAPGRRQLVLGGIAVEGAARGGEVAPRIVRGRDGARGGILVEAVGAAARSRGICVRRKGQEAALCLFIIGKQRSEQKRRKSDEKAAASRHNQQ